MSEVHETIKDIKARFRQFMNGMASQSMRDKGLNYKLNFGIEYPRIKEIAAMYEPDHDLAQALWKENIRECKIMAGLLQPVDTFYPEIAEIWIEDMHFPEIAEYTVMNLFQNLPYAAEVVFQWMADDRDYFRICGLLLAARLFIKKMDLNERAESEFLDQAFTALQDVNFFVQRSASVALRKYAILSKENMRKINRQLEALKKSEKPNVAILVEEIKNDVEYCS